ncbi:hypothetical protein [Cellulophaga fucicola]|uniref:Uncharacterized protein n=1 Tax=Cellulophaga fucicola TaxID=76595 RepID=A0A1K1NYF9_9FLAO|nr:hypothetical protein [Cellulophaga fucicola]SFW40305.1 hypothetical protein SAMN05660313_01454 [Cellulophaga fucicola]
MKYKVIVGAIAFMVLVAFLSEWANFKAGLFGEAPIEKVHK